MNKAQMEIRRIENAIKREERIEELKNKHGITGTRNQQIIKLRNKKQEYELDK